ncbi:MAG: hypothetical protein IPM88_05905 [Nitrospira sp.]|nr:hypothetical protein [Nitrospira sp.]
MTHGSGNTSEWLVVIGLAVRGFVSSPVIGGAFVLGKAWTFADTFRPGLCRCRFRGWGSGFLQ